MDQKYTKSDPKWAKMDPKWAKMDQELAKMAQSGLKRTKSELKWTHNGTWMDQKKTKSGLKVDKMDQKRCYEKSNSSMFTREQFGYQIRTRVKASGIINVPKWTFFWTKVDWNVLKIDPKLIVKWAKIFHRLIKKSFSGSKRTKKTKIHSTKND